MITVTGSLAFDYIMDFPGIFSEHIMPDKIHTLNLSFLVNTLNKQFGGTAGNIAYNLALLKSPASIVGTVGHDFSEYSEFLKNSGVDISNIKILEDKFSSSAFIMTDKQDNQITAFHPGAMTESSSQSLEDVKTEFVVISPNDPKAMVKFASECKNKKIPYMLDPGMQLPSLDKNDLKNMLNGAAILIGNDYEIELLSNKIQVTSNKLLEDVEILIITLGKMGSIIQKGEQLVDVKPCKPKEVLDPTGAGDAYRAGFLAGFIKKFDLKVCGQMGSVAACYAIEKYGTTQHKFTVEEFKERYRKNFGEELKLESSDKSQESRKTNT